MKKRILIWGILLATSIALMGCGNKGTGERFWSATDEHEVEIKETETPEPIEIFTN